MTDEPRNGQPEMPMTREGGAHAVAADAVLAVTATLDLEGRRLLWRCRRGMKELDVILDRFARAELPAASAEQRRTFALFLELPDPVLVDYLLGYAIPPEPELAELAGRIAGQRIAPRPIAVPAPHPMAVGARPGAVQ